MVFLILAVVLFTVANARAARLVGERWGIDTAIAWRHLALVLVLDVVILVAVGTTGSVWTAVALLPVVATIVFASLRAAGRSRGTGRAQSIG
ncbi:MAG TPA: hypothetical protein VEC15_09685 [Actinomycetota bacterium]|nr:hypothetical protein [Actinomycetota bacterium]